MNTRKILVLSYCPPQGEQSNPYARERKFLAHHLGMSMFELFQMLEFEYLFPNWTGKYNGELHSPKSAAVRRTMRLNLSGRRVVVIGFETLLALQLGAIGVCVVPAELGQAKRIVSRGKKYIIEKYEFLYLPTPLGKDGWYSTSKAIRTVGKALTQLLNMGLPQKQITGASV
jgi:hypothetical protein